MRYVSDVTNRVYDSIEALEAAEAEVRAAEEKRKAELEAASKKKQELKEQREARAKEVEDALKAANEAEKKANDLLKAFCADYGAFHTTFKGDSVFPLRSSLWDLFF